METYITQDDVLISIKRYRDSLTEEERKEKDVEAKIVKLSDRTRAKLQSKPTASETRRIRYAAKYEALRNKESLN
jgi:hypothetical protein